VQDPSIASVAGWRSAKTRKARIVGELRLVAPVLQVKRWIGHDEISLEIWVLIGKESISRTLSQIAGKPTHR